MIFDPVMWALAKKSAGGGSGGGGGDTPSANIQPLEVTANGTYLADGDVTGYSPVVVNVESSGDGDVLGGILNKTLVEANSDTVVELPSRYFQGFANLTTANFPAVTKLTGYVFYECFALKTANFPSVETIEGNDFYSCEALVSLNLPLLKTVNGGNAFLACKALEILDLPSCLNLNGMQTFRYCYALKALVLRSTTMCSLNSASSTFTNSNLASGGGYIYVPAALVDTYKAATNWSAYAAQFRALEDYTVDGTITGALDKNKI